MLNLFFVLISAFQTTHTVSFRASIPEQDLGTVVHFQIPKFDPNLGTLVKVESWTDFTLTKNDAVEALCSCDEQVCATFDESGSFYYVSTRLPFPLLTFLSEDDVAPLPENICASGPFDGMDDFMGPSATVGATETTNKVGTPFSYLYTDFNYFTGFGMADLDSYFNGISYISIQNNPKCPQGADALPLNVKSKEIKHIRYTYTTP